jgi:hypothetical protein
VSSCEVVQVHEVLLRKYLSTDQCLLRQIQRSVAGSCLGGITAEMLCARSLVGKCQAHRRCSEPNKSRDVLLATDSECDHMPEHSENLLQRVHMKL